ncbi:hypothetical protein P5G51_005245 [Virgibacillus sp. 179-BFC.A HS]|uniref:Uncharacterized protein n=1 Tax=Tigheibacillus jepli TaxID=3035914 RepID=A0ABU5CF12_9BACI|nr:hypothetical protein [Virgibacillus sp. 179-BFC.A HS]MDY0404881.1 hypothetical protein [Virgibacillus sp. 179-BFC.A HS]
MNKMTMEDLKKVLKQHENMILQLMQITASNNLQLSKLRHTSK